MKPTESEMHKQIDLASKAEQEETGYYGMSYEEGVKAALLWAMGQTTEKPIEE